MEPEYKNHSELVSVHGGAVQKAFSGIAEPSRVDSKGFVSIPQKPGLGIELNEDIIKNTAKSSEKSQAKYHFIPTDSLLGLMESAML